MLEESPQIVALQLSWDMDVQGSDIGATLGAVQEILHLPALYPAVDPGVKNRTFRLQSMVAYYGQHYMALVYNHEVGAWLLFDDASISQVGQWADVVKKCQAGRIQPSVLFYLEDATAAKGGDTGAAATDSARGVAFQQQQPVQQQQQPKPVRAVGPSGAVHGSAGGAAAVGGRSVPMPGAPRDGMGAWGKGAGAAAPRPAAAGGVGVGAWGGGRGGGAGGSAWGNTSAGQENGASGGEWGDSAGGQGKSGEEQWDNGGDKW